jgi:acetylglutamate kinase
MLPKLENAFDAINAGVEKVIIGDATDLNKLVAGEAGTQIIP